MYIINLDVRDEAISIAAPNQSWSAYLRVKQVAKRAEAYE